MKASRSVKFKYIPNGLKNIPVKHKKIPQPHAAEELFKLHSLMAFIGHRGSGKTHAIVNLAKRYLDEGSFTRVFVISPTYESNPVFHVLEIEKEDVYMDHTNALGAIQDILKKCKQDSDDYDDYEEYMKAYRKWKRGKTLSNDEHTMLDNNNFDKPSEVIPRPSPLLIIDDMSHSDIYSTSRQNPFINLCLRHRYEYQSTLSYLAHFNFYFRHINHGKGITIMMAAQTFRSGIPLPLRQNIQQYFIWPTHDKGQLEAVYQEVANLIDEEAFMKIYREATREPHSFLSIDTTNIPEKQFRKNFDTLLIPDMYHNDSDSDSITNA